jgi:hypothetical protein
MGSRIRRKVSLSKEKGNNNAVVEHKVSNNASCELQLDQQVARPSFCSPVGGDNMALVLPRVVFEQEDAVSDDSPLSPQSCYGDDDAEEDSTFHYRISFGGGLSYTVNF